MNHLTPRWGGRGGTTQGGAPRTEVRFVGRSFRREHLRLGVALRVENERLGVALSVENERLGVAHVVHGVGVAAVLRDVHTRALDVGGGAQDAHQLEAEEEEGGHA